MVLLAPLEVDEKATEGFTLIELLVVVGIVSMMTSLLYFSTNTVQTSTDAQTAADRLTAHIKTQRIYAMLGSDPNQSKTIPHGVHFEEGSGVYTLFSCPHVQNCSYTPGRPDNVIENLGKTLVFRDVSLAGNQLIFVPQSGEILDYDTASNSVTIENLVDRTEHTVRLNMMGTVSIE